MKKSLIILPFVIALITMSSCASSVVENIQEDQSLYNRIIKDYYEQRLTNAKTMGLNMYSPNYSASISEIKLEEVDLSFIMSKTNCGAYLVGVENSLNTWGEMFYYGFNDSFTANQIRIPDVWYNGKIYYLTDAFYQGIISQEEVSQCLNKVGDIWQYKDEFIVKEDENIRFDENVNTLEVKKEDFTNSLLNKIREDFYRKEIENNPFYNDYEIVLDDIHIFQSFGQINEAACVNFSIDGITQPNYACNVISKEWNNNLVFDDIEIERFQDEIPVVWVDRDFYPIDEAFNKNKIDKETAVNLLRQYKISAKQNNGEKYIF